MFGLEDAKSGSVRLMYLSAHLGQEPRQTASPGRRAAGPQYLPGQTTVTDDDDDDVTESELQCGPQALDPQPRGHTRMHACTCTCTQRERSFLLQFQSLADISSMVQL